VYTKEELDSYRESPWGTTFREQKEGLEFSADQYKELEDYAKSLGIDFIVSCWDEKSVDLIESSCDVKYHKVASAMLTDKSFLEKLKKTGKKIILSTGMSTEEEVDAAVKILGESLEYILACTSTYPTVAEETNLSYIKKLKTRYPLIKVGFSNHSNGSLASLSAVALGSECLEFHITKDRTMYGSDQSASIENVSGLLDGVRKIEVMLGDGEKKVYDSEKPIIKKLRKKSDIL
jgi:N-acetylneuraminate synthase